MSLSILSIVHSRGVYTFPYSGVVILLELSLTARREKRPLIEVFREAHIEEVLLTHLEDSGSWFYRHLIALATVGGQIESFDPVPAEWESLVGRFWEMASRNDGKIMAEIVVFLSYSRQDIAMAREVAYKLREKKMAVWHDELESRVGDPIIEMISKGIDEANAMVVLVSKASMASSWVCAEIEIAVKRNLPIFPVLLENCNIHSALRGIVYEDFRNVVNRAEQLERLAAAILRKTKAPST
ncbi:MAG: toll/interleukin-1 receptor domain-containing protein [Haliscomenobacteraceae bacterium CHB4]|nr:hypothetical protein [Saprospiraceae bacterium]MCE7923699.1 toll/interleukin-1 receptor domain-containing protein [Haliscomenobacteraceae bacterium CHB4]